MKLAHHALNNPICFYENHIPILIIEAPKMFRQFVFELLAQSEGLPGKFVLSLAHKILDCGEHLHVIYDYYHLEPEGRKLQSRFQSQIQYCIKNQLIIETRELEKSICQYLEQLCLLCSPAAFETAEYIPLLLKGAKLRPALEDESPLERLISHLSIYNSLLPNQCFILISAKTMFDTDELLKLYRWANYAKCRLLLLESFQSQPLKNESAVILDKDMCEIYIDSINRNNI